MKEDLLSIMTAMMLSLMMFASFIMPILAVGVDQEDGWSNDGNAFALVLGKYTQIGTTYDLRQHHYSEVKQANTVYNSSFCFRQWNSSGTVWERVGGPLEPYSSVENTTYHDGVRYMRTCTFSGSHIFAWMCTIDFDIGPPGAQ